MKTLFFASLSLFFAMNLHAQLMVHQTGDKSMVKAFAERPQEFLSDLNMLRGFGSFLIADQGDENFDNLVGFYEIEKEELFNTPIDFYVQAQLLNEKGKIVAKTQAVKGRMRPGGDASQAKRSQFPGDQGFPGEYQKLEKGRYELRLVAKPIDKEVARMCVQGKPEVQYFFER